MYNGRATQPPAPEQKQPINSTVDWSRPRKGSYGEYKQSKLSQVGNGYQEGSLPAPLGPNMSRALAAKSSLNKSGIEVGYERRSSMNFYDKEQSRPSQFGHDKYAINDVADYSKPSNTKYSSEQQTNFEPRYSRPSTASTLGQPPTKSYHQSYAPVGDEYKANIYGAYPDPVVGTIVPAVQRKRASFSQNNEELYERSFKSRELYGQEMGTKRQSRGLDRRFQQNLERDITDRTMEGVRPRLDEADLGRGKIYSDKPQNQLYNETNKFDQKYGSKYGHEDAGYLSRRDQPRLYGQQDNNESRSYHRFNPSEYNPNDHEMRQPALYSRNNDRNNTEYQNKHSTDRMTEVYANRTKQTLRPYPPQNNPKNSTPTRMTTTQGPSQSYDEPALSQSRRQLLIEKSKNLSQRMNELSAKKLGTSASKDQNQFKFHPEIDQERIERIKKNKQRVYDSPFKEKVKSSTDLKLKYQIQSESDPQFVNPPNSTFSSKPCNLQSDPALRKSDMNDFSKSIERSQELMKKLNQTKESLGGPRKGNIENEIGKQYQSHTNSIDSNCMNRINALNSKINEKISMLINAYEK